MAKPKGNLHKNFVVWVKRQCEALVLEGGQKQLARRLGLSDSTINQWVHNQVTTLSDDAARALRAYMASLLGDEKIIMPSIEDVKKFASHGVLPTGDGALRISDTTDVLTWIDVVDPVEVAKVVKAGGARLERHLSAPVDGSERLRQFILAQLKKAGASTITPAEFAKGVWSSRADIDRVERWLRGTEPIPRDVLGSLASIVTVRCNQPTDVEDLSAIYDGTPSPKP